MESLNIDRIFEILKYLNLKDQISFHQVNSSAQLATRILWKKQYKHLYINFLKTPIDSAAFKAFLSTIKETVETMHLESLNRQLYGAMEKMKFKNLKKFKFILEKHNSLTDNDLRDLNIMMPNLEALSPSGSHSGEFINKWPSLKELDLSKCFHIRRLHLKTIMLKLKLEKLELGHVRGTNVTRDNMYLLENLKYLRTCLDTYYFLSFHFARSLKEIQIFYDQEFCHHTYYIRLDIANNILHYFKEMNKDVEGMTLFYAANPLEGYSMQSLICLRKLRFVECLFSMEYFLSLIENSTQLDEISFEQCWLDQSDILLNVSKITANRTKTLKLNMWENEFYHTERLCNVKLSREHNLLNVTSLPGPKVSFDIDILHLVFT